MKEDNVQ